MIIPFWAKAVVLAAAIGGLSFYWYRAGFNARDLEVKTEQLNTIKDLQAQKDAKEASLRETSQKLQDALSHVKVQVVYVDRLTQKEIEKPIYQQCIVPESGGILINQNADRFNSLRAPVK